MTVLKFATSKHHRINVNNAQHVHTKKDRLTTVIYTTGQTMSCWSVLGWTCPSNCSRLISDSQRPWSSDNISAEEPPKLGNPQGSD